jgi:hypothetical protein
METQRINFQVGNIIVTAMCYLFYNPLVQVVVVRIFS